MKCKDRSGKKPSQGVGKGSRDRFPTDDKYPIEYLEKEC
jgi:hypothetical protein